MREKKNTLIYLILKKIVTYISASLFTGLNQCGTLFDHDRLAINEYFDFLFFGRSGRKRTYYIIT